MPTKEAPSEEALPKTGRKARWKRTLSRWWGEPPAVDLGRGYLIEMQTGEGQTLAAVAPACLQALSGFMLSLGHRMFDRPWLNTQLGDHHERSLLAATSQKGGFAHGQPFAVHKALKGLFMVGLERQSEA